MNTLKVQNAKYYLTYKILYVFHLTFFHMTLMMDRVMPPKLNLSVCMKSSRHQKSSDEMYL